MLYLYQSNRLEDLAALLQAVQTKQPLNQPLAAEEIVVQSQGMRRFLTRYLAHSSGVAANLRFSLPAGLTWRLMRESLPDIPPLSPFSPEVMRWRLLELFNSEHFRQSADLAAARQALHSYLTGGDTAAYQLAGRLADMFDQYLVYRGEWIDSWQAGQAVGLGEEEAWQAELWRYLDDGRQNTPHRVALWQQLLHHLSAEKLPQRFFVFGIATLAPMYLQLLQALAEEIDVHIFALNPSSEYWGNIIEPVQILNSSDDTDLSQSGHPLLASLGKQGRDFFNALADTQAQIELPVYPERSLSESLLQRLQSDIQTLSLPTPKPLAEQDNSIRIVSAHSPLRELQILKHHLLHLLHQHPDWQPHDIAVLTPDITPYSPFIEAVFGQAEGGMQALPYSVADVKLSRRQPLLYALEQALALLESRFEVDQLLPLLDSEIVLRRFELSRQDLPLLHDTIARLNIHWGLDQTMRGGTDNLFTWQQGLDRLVLGWLMPENSGLWQNLSPWFADPNQLGTLSRFSALLRTLARLQQQWHTATDIPGWAARVRELTAELFTPEESDQTAQQQLEQALARWQEEATLAGFTQTLPPSTAIRHLKRFLDSQSESGLLHGGITFCSMVPMRSLPFKAICLLGLNDGDFPRNTKAAGYDLIARHPRAGDRARRDDDRYLFLEAIFSARENLYLSYIGRSIRNNEALEPSALVSELIDTLAAMTGCTPEQFQQQHLEQHPLQAFSHQYFTGGALRSGRSDYAEALNRPAAEAPPFYQTPLSEPHPPAETITQESLLHFWRNPVRAWLNRTLGWQEPYHDEAWDAAEPFEPAHADQINQAYLNARRQHENFTDTGARLQAESQLPGGELGRLWQNRFETAAKALDSTLLDSPRLPVAAYTLNLEQHQLQGSLGQLHQHGQIFFPTRAPSAPEKIIRLLQHLIFNAVRPQGVQHFDSHWLLPDHPQTIPAIPQADAARLLENWLIFYQIGQQQPLPFFAKTSLAAALALNSSKPDAADKARKDARSSYFGSHNSIGQRDYTEVGLVFGHSEPPPIESDLFRAMVENMLLPTIQACQSEAETTKT